MVFLSTTPRHTAQCITIDCSAMLSPCETALVIELGIVLLSPPSIHNILQLTHIATVPMTHKTNFQI